MTSFYENGQRVSQVLMEMIKSGDNFSLPWNWLENDVWMNILQNIESSMNDQDPMAT